MNPIERAVAALDWFKEQVYEVALRFAEREAEPRPVEVAQFMILTGPWRVMVEPDKYIQGRGRFLIPFLRKDGSTFTRWMVECPPEWCEMRLTQGRVELFGPGRQDLTATTITYRRTAAGPIWYEEV